MPWTKIRLYSILVLIVLGFLLISAFSIKNISEGDLKIVEVDVTNRHSNIKLKQKLFDLDFHYTLNNATMCEKDSNILAIFIVTSYFANTETRSSMRRSFTREELKLLNFRRVFLLGEAPSDKYVNQNAIENESKKFGDIIQGNFIEAYKNLTYKHIMGLKWVTDHCYNAQFVIKMDDDIVVNIERLPSLLNSFKLPSNGNFMAGYVLRKLHPIREPANKWFVTTEEYEPNTYPTFLSGWFYVTNPGTCAKLYTLSRYTKYFWIDDTYVTGILAKQLKIKHFDISKQFTVHSEFLNCCIQDIQNNQVECDILIGPNGGDNNLFYDFNNALNICNLKLCRARSKPINETCVAERKFFLGKGKAVVERYKLH